jgi:capsular exopolysaccharide synthesis family protein
MSMPTLEQPAMPALGENAFRDFLSVLARRRRIVLLALGLTTAVAVALSRVVPPVYEASSALIVYKNPPVVLLANPYFGQESSLFQQQVAQASDVVTVTEIVKSGAVRDAAVARLTPLVDPERLSSILARLRVQQARSSDVVRISATHTDPNIAAAVANAVVQSVIDLDLKGRRHLVSQTRKYLGEQLAVARQNLEASEHALVAFKNEHRDVSIAEETLLKLRQLAGLEDKLAEVRLQQRETQAGYVRSASLRPSTQSAPDPLVATLQGQLAVLEVERSGLRKQFTAVHPAVLSIEAKIEETKTRLSAAIAQGQAALAAREQKLAADISQVERALAQIPAREAELAHLTRDAKDAERTAALLAAKLQEARIAEGSIGSAVQVLDVAKPPQKPVWPKKGLIVPLAVVAGLLLGVTGAYLIEQVDESVKSAGDVERLLGAPVLSTIPVLNSGRGRDSRGAPPLVLPSDQTPRGAEAFEAFRSLRAHILGAMAKAQYKCLLITSAQRHEGKSTIVANLGIAVAQTDRRVLLVDCDLRRPTLRRLFPGADSPGLSGVLAGKADVGDVVRSTPHARLKCVDSGPAVHNPSELLDTKRMSEVMAQIRDQADLILLDSPAVLPVADAEVAGLQADGAIVVVRVGKTDRRALAEVRHRLDRVGVRVIGSVLNYSRNGSHPYRY